MPPNSEFVPVSTLKIKPPPNRANVQNGNLWLKDKQITDGAEGFWRIHDSLYDFTEFVDTHPGGSEWLELTKGTDITEAFEVHHLTHLPESLLQKYYIRKAQTKRNCPFTFKEDGFYRTLKREVMKILKDLPDQPYNTSIFFTDFLLGAVFFFSVIANLYWNFWLGMVAGMFMSFLGVAAHNYFHMKDNYRMYYFNVTLMQTREWRITHVLSHHLHTNTIDDMELTMNEPIIQFLVHKKKTPGVYLYYLVFPFFWASSFHLQFFKRVYYLLMGQKKSMKWSDLIGFALPLVMYLTGGQSLLNTLWMWTVIILFASFVFNGIGINAAHHHPDIFHDGDTPRSDTDYDWGLSQLDAVMDRSEITGSHFLVLTTFGDHCLHHIFPTIDHGRLELLYPTLRRVCDQFNVNFRVVSFMDMMIGSFQQIVKDKPNPNPPNLLKKY